MGSLSEQVTFEIEEYYDRELDEKCARISGICE